MLCPLDQREDEAWWAAFSAEHSSCGNRCAADSRWIRSHSWVFRWLLWPGGLLPGSGWCACCSCTGGSPLLATVVRALVTSWGGGCVFLQCMLLVSVLGLLLCFHPAVLFFGCCSGVLVLLMLGAPRD